jgi:hypothetical protein
MMDYWNIPSFHAAAAERMAAKTTVITVNYRNSDT